MRKTVARQIFELAKSADPFAELDARHIALYGQALSDYQLRILYLYLSKRRFKVNSRYLLGGQISSLVPEMSAEERSYRHWEKLVCDVFIKAVLRHDRKTIIELADAAEFFKDKLADDYVPADPERLKLLKIKNQPRAFAKKFTIRQIAEQIYSKKETARHSADGFSALRRKCKELKISIRPSRKTSGE